MHACLKKLLPIYCIFLECTWDREPLMFHNSQLCFKIVTKSGTSTYSWKKTFIAIFKINMYCTHARKVYLLIYIPVCCVSNKYLKLFHNLSFRTDVFAVYWILKFFLKNGLYIFLFEKVKNVDYVKKYSHNHIHVNMFTIRETGFHERFRYW